MEVHLPVADFKRNQRIETRQQERVRYFHFSARDVDGNVAVSENVFGFADRRDQFQHPAQLVFQHRIKRITPVAFRTDRLKIPPGDVGQVELYDAFAFAGKTVKVDLRLRADLIGRFAHSGFPFAPVHFAVSRWTSSRICAGFPAASTSSWISEELRNLREMLPSS
ncbi:hypothetical protein SDC9_138929 [bioreactor metagenome]|uniref:Uncharacterized protein n=1 Tax=bioreactor metagenome TaxID=1076179 RepID=A0A645DRA3_9ZZZZ